MFDYEYGQADYDLDEIKEKLFNYLANCNYAKGKDPKTEAKKTFNYLETVVESIIKRKKIKIHFGSGGSPSWHSAVLYYLSRWISAELKIGKLLAERLSSIEINSSTISSETTVPAGISCLLSNVKIL